MKKTVVFIAGPMTGKPDYNRAAFHAAAEQLRSDGFIVLNPAVFPDGLEHHQYMVMTLAMLEQADAIWLLDGWENSTGARQEACRARALGLLFLSSALRR